MPPIFPFIWALALWLGACAPALALAGTPPLPALLRESRFVTYTPRSFAVAGATITPATVAGIREDLKLLRPLFNGLITYSAVNGQELIPGIAHEQGFRAMIMGVWDPHSEEEIANVILAAKRFPNLVAAVCVGNEGLYTKRYQPEEVERAMARIKRQCPTLAVTTSEPFFLYFKSKYAAFFKAHTLLLPIVHPLFEPWFKPEEPTHGVAMVLNVTKEFQASYTLPLLIKETGMPSGPEGRTAYTPARQALFWSELFSRFPTSPSLALAAFEAFDAPWKPQAMAVDFPGNHASEAFWGFFTAHGKAKEVVKTVVRLNGRRTLLF